MNIDRDDGESSCLWSKASEASSLLKCSKPQTYTKRWTTLNSPEELFAGIPESPLRQSCMLGSSLRRPSQRTTAYAGGTRPIVNGAGASGESAFAASAASCVMAQKDFTPVLTGPSDDAVSEARRTARPAAGGDTADSTTACRMSVYGGSSAIALASGAFCLPTAGATSPETAAAASRERSRRRRRELGVCSRSSSMSSVSRSSISGDDGRMSSSTGGSPSIAQLRHASGGKRSSLFQSGSTRFSLSRRRFRNFARGLMRSVGGQQQQQHCQVEAPAAAAQQQQESHLDQETSTIVMVSDCDRFYMCTVESDQDDRMSQSSSVSLDRRGALAAAAACAAEAAVFSSRISVDCHAAIPASGLDISFSRSSSSYDPNLLREAGSLHSIGDMQQQQHLPQDNRPQPDVLQGSSDAHASNEKNPTAPAGVGYDARRVVTEQQQARSPAAAAADAGGEESFSQSSRRRPHGAHRTAAAHDQKPGADRHAAYSASSASAAAAGFPVGNYSASSSFSASAGMLPAESSNLRAGMSGSAATGGGGFACRRGGSIYAAASAAAGRAALNTYESTRRRLPFFLVLVVQLCLCGALVVAGCVGFARMSGHTTEKPGDATAATYPASGFPASEGFGAARDSETLLRWTLLVSAVAACAAVISKRFLFSRMWLRFRKHVGGKRWPLLSLRCRYVCCCFRGSRKQKQDSAKKSLPLQELHSAHTHRYHFHDRRSFLRHIPAYHMHPVYLRNQREEVAALACALLLALCGAALVMPSVVVLGAFCHFSDRNWTQQSQLQQLPSFSLPEANEASHHAASLCDNKGIVLSCLVLACLLSLCELLLLWMHRGVATAAAIAAGTAAAAAALATRLTYAHSASDRRVSACHPHAPLQYTHTSLSMSPTAAAAVAANSKIDQQVQQHRIATSQEKHQLEMVSDDAAGQQDGDRKESSPMVREKMRSSEENKHKASRPLREQHSDYGVSHQGISHQGREEDTKKKRASLLGETKQERRCGVSFASQGEKEGVSGRDRGDAGTKEKKGKVRWVCTPVGFSLWDAVLILGYEKFLSGCVLLFAASLLLHERSCYRSTHGFLRKDVMLAAGVTSHSSLQAQSMLEETYVMPYTVGQEAELIFGSSVTGMMLIAAVNMTCGIYGTICGWKRSPLLSGLNLLLNAIIIWMEFATCVGLYFGASGLKFFCNYSDYPVSQEPLPRFLANYLCSSSQPPFLIGWIASGAAFAFVFVDLVVDIVLLCREVGDKVSWKVQGVTGVQS